MFRVVAFSFFLFFLIKGKKKEAVPVLGSHRNCVAPNVV